MDRAPDCHRGAVLMVLYGPGRRPAAIKVYVEI